REDAIDLRRLLRLVDPEVQRERRSFLLVRRPTLRRGEEEKQAAAKGDHVPILRVSRVPGGRWRGGTTSPLRTWRGTPLRTHPRGGPRPRCSARLGGFSHEAWASAGFQGRSVGDVTLEKS